MKERAQSVGVLCLILCSPSMFLCDAAGISTVNDEDGPLAPNLTCSFDDEGELLRLFFGRDRVAEYGRSKTALRADAELRQGKILACRRDTPAQVAHALEPAGFSGDQAEHDEFVFGYVLERRERARAIVVVLEQKPLHGEPSEEPATDRFVTSLGEPPAALIAASEMERESDIWKSADDGIVQLDAARQPLVQTPALLFVETPCLGVEHQPVVRRIDLDVTRAQARQFLHLFAQELNDVREETIQSRVRGPGVFTRPEVRPKARARQRNFRHAAGFVLQIGKLITG